MMEAAEIVRRIGSPVKQLPDGRYQCPVCEDFTAPATKTIGVHMSRHWKEAGVEHPPHSDDRIDCPDGHGRYKRGMFALHLQNVHKVPALEATAIARTFGFSLDAPKLAASTGRPKHIAKKVSDMTPEEHAQAKAYWRDERRRKSEKDVAAGKVKRKVGRPRKEEVRHLPATVKQTKHAPILIDPADAAIAVVQSQVNGHGVPAHLLHDVIQYVDHTRELAAKLREV